MPLTVLAPGLQTRPVTAGRPGLRAFGMPVGGAADQKSFRIGQALAGNRDDQSALEINFAGPTLRSEGRTGVVVVGAPFACEIIGRGRVAIGECVTLEDGEILKITGAARGARAYVCVPGGFGSDMAPLAVNQTLKSKTSSLPHWSIRDEFDISPEPIRVLPGPQFDWFLKPVSFENQTFTVAPASDRMGVRLRGDRLERKPGELTSEPVAPGAIQITNDGHPVILGVDGQTIGGYPKIAHVIRAEMDRVGQLRPGDTLRFRFISMAEADAANRQADKHIEEWLVRIRTRCA